ncbi:cGMP-gated cation channel alpha-1, partial [Orchesella cincta]
VLSDDEKHVIVTIRSGSVIGEVHLLQPYPHLTTVRCGSDCDILVLTRKHFRRVLNTYPQYIPTLEQTLETRLEETGLLLALAEKHNTYHKVFRALREMHNNEDTGFHDQDLDHHSFENVMKVLEPHAAYEDGNSLRTSEDLDGLNVTQEMEERLLHRSTVINKAQPRYEELVQAALAAIEADVTRAGSLALDLEIHVPPLFVSAPEAAIHVTLGFNHQKDSENIFVKLGKCLKDPRKGNGHMLWKFIVSVCALLAFWYYLYQFAFRDLAHVKFDYYMHLTDLIFLSNCIYDMMQIVVTPQRSFESAKDIAMYRFRSFYFYLRIFSWLPFEYLSARLVGYGRSLSPWFYFSKFNRLVEVHLVFRFLSEFETRSNISPTLLFIGKYVLGLFFVSHIFTVIYMFVLRDINS